MKIAIYGQNFIKKANNNAFEILIDFLFKTIIDCIYVEEQFLQLQNKKINNNSAVKKFNTLDDSFDLLISIGGDGTILRAITYVRDLGIPIVGINTGHLGFLAGIQTDAIQAAFSEILKGNYKLSKRALLSVKTTPNNNNILETNFALNEVTISRKNTTSMISVKTYINDEYLTSYWSDGLILSTPTGSTGYSLSCGGPIIAPDTKSFVITPIAPHNLNARPLIISDNKTIKLTVDGREDQFLMSLDSRITTLSNTTEVVISKSNFVINLVELLDETFLDTLRKKLLWGEDRRN